MKIDEEILNEFFEYKRRYKNLNSHTLEMYKIDLNNFETFVGKSLLDVKFEDVVRYIEELRKSYKKSSVVRKISTLKGFYKYLLEKNVIDILPTDGIVLERPIAKEIESLEGWEINGILDQCDKTPKGIRDRLVLRIMIDTSLSLNDVLNIKVSDLLLTDYKYIIQDVNQNKIRISDPIGDKIEKFVRGVRNELKDSDSDYLFSGLTRQNFRARFINLGKKAGIERNISPSMLKNSIKKMSANDEEVYSFRESLRKRYFDIGIGDD